MGIKLNENFLTAVMLNFTIRCGPLSWGKRCVPAWGTSAICWPVSRAFSLKEVKSVWLYGYNLGQSRVMFVSVEC